METFLSIQGEGLQMGRLTYFIRAAGCNLRCSWCDTGYALEPSDAKSQMSVPEIMALIGDVRSVCLTGGEPLLQYDAKELISAMVSAGKVLVLETNGSVSIAGLPDSRNLIISMDIKCPSSGMQDRMDLDNLAHLGSKDHRRRARLRLRCRFHKEASDRGQCHIQPGRGHRTEGYRRKGRRRPSRRQGPAPAPQDHMGGQEGGLSPLRCFPSNFFSSARRSLTVPMQFSAVSS